MRLFRRILTKFKKAQGASDQDQVLTLTAVKAQCGDAVKETLLCHSKTPGSNPSSCHKPKGFPIMLAECRVLSLPDTLHRGNIESFVTATNWRISLERDPLNTIDRNAIKVMGVWQDCVEQWHIGQIGWLPSDIAFQLAREVPDASTRAEIISISAARDIRGPSVHIAIWGF